VKLLTEQLKRQLPRLGTQECIADPVVRLHYFNPVGTGDWFIIEGEPVVEGEKPYDYLFFGLCDLGFPELGYVRLSELSEVKLWGGALGIERDLHWTPTPLSKCRERGA
jgi:hypothetical protein